MNSELRYKYNSIILNIILYLPLISLLWDMFMVLCVMVLCILGLNVLWFLSVLVVYSAVRLPIEVYYKRRR